MYKTQKTVDKYVYNWYNCFNRVEIFVCFDADYRAGDLQIRV